MRAQRLWLGLGVAAAMLVAVASAAGVFSSDYVYARETASWAAQGIGQDWANLLLVVPVLLLTTWRAARGSARALALWRGLLLYVIYSYVLYSFFIHFNRLFLVYVGALALAFFAFVGSCVAERQQQPASRGSVSLASTVLVVCAVLFAFMWLSE